MPTPPTQLYSRQPPVSPSTTTTTSSAMYVAQPPLVGMNAQPRHVWAHTDYEVAQTQLEVVQAVARAKMEAALAKRAVVHAHVPPPRARSPARGGGGEMWDGGMRGMLDGITRLWVVPDGAAPQRGGGRSRERWSDRFSDLSA